ncbi:hypothetical protein SEUCBS140593_002895 [Sporothrix eucalyptigena]|uniref:DNA repair protein rad9 n=1 Tax=Sporothrix eucalyptigena TaxID=1812306 RepID=A0ABP0BA79_9PEZI
MVIVSFTLTDEGVASFQNALACILKFSEDVSLDARRDRALLSIFRSRAGGDASRGGSADSNIERCDVSIEDGPDRKSRFVAKIAWRNGITATHAISFEAKAPVMAKFDSSQADNQWSISAHTLRRLMDHFGPKVELLDINTEGEGVLNLTCSTEKQYTKTDGILNMNLHTSIAVKMDDFDDIDTEDKHHIIINFVLMTVGEKEGSNIKKDGARVRNSRTTRPSLPATITTPSATTAEPGQRLTNRVELESSQAGALPSTARTGPIPPDVNSGFEMRPPLAPPSTIRVEALYDEDSQWEPINPEEENPGFVQIEWDESLRPELAFVPITNAQDTHDDEPAAPDVSGGLEPTQRLTQVRKFGLFD